MESLGKAGGTLKAEKGTTERSVLGRADVVVVGGGSAGLMAAVAAAARGVGTVLLEKNPRPGRKLALRGPGKRYLTNLLHPVRFTDNFGKGGSFLRPAVTAFPGYRLLDLLERRGAESEVVERYRVVPKGGRYGDVLRALLEEASEREVEIVSSFHVEGIDLRPSDAHPFLAYDREGLGYAARRLILATGGLAHPETGATGEGFQWARDLRHTVVPPVPALVGLQTKGLDVDSIDGLAVEDVEIELLSSQFRSPLAMERGTLKFGKGGISGPAVLDLSIDAATIGRGQNLVVKINFFPDTPIDVLQTAIERRVAARPQKLISEALSRDALPRHMPARLLEALIGASFPGLRSAKCTEFPTATRRLLAERLKGFELEVIGDEGFKHALTTDGGVSVDEVDDATLESKLVPGLHFAGEILDVTGRYGGFNPQAAFATGFLAGESAAQALGGSGGGLPEPERKPLAVVAAQAQAAVAAARRASDAARAADASSRRSGKASAAGSGSSREKSAAGKREASSTKGSKSSSKKAGARKKKPAARAASKKKPARKKATKKSAPGKASATKKKTAKKSPGRKSPAKKSAPKKTGAKKTTAKDANKAKAAGKSGKKAGSAGKKKAAAVRKTTSARKASAHRGSGARGTRKTASKRSATSKGRSVTRVAGRRAGGSAAKRASKRNDSSKESRR